MGKISFIKDISFWKWIAIALWLFKNLSIRTSLLLFSVYSANVFRNIFFWNISIKPSFLLLCFYGLNDFNIKQACRNQMFSQSLYIYWLCIRFFIFSTMYFCFQIIIDLKHLIHSKSFRFFPTLIFWFLLNFLLYFH